MDTQKPLSLAGLSAGDMVAVAGGIQIEEDHMRNVVSRNTAMQSKWSPRTGASLEQRLWLDEVEDVLARFGESIDTLNEPEPSFGSLSHSISLGAEAKVRLFHLARQEWQVFGTAIFDAVRPSLILDGKHFEIDLAAIKKMKSVLPGGHAFRDGRALIRWALEFVDKTSIEAQLSIVDDLSKKKLGANATVADLDVFLHDFYKLWLSKTGSDSRRPEEFWVLLLAALPSEPTTSKLAQIRKYAADEIFKRSPLAYDLDGEKGLFHQLSLYAAQVVGLASGFRVPKAGEVLLLGTGAPVGSERQESKCGWCNCYACEAVGLAAGGKPQASCMGRDGSQADISKLSKGGRIFAQTTRKWCKANPGKSPKKINFKLERIKANEAKPRAEAADAAATAKSVGAVTLLGESAGLQSFFGGEITDPLEFNAWLSKQCGESSHLMMLGEVDGCHIVAEEQGEHEEPPWRRWPKLYKTAMQQEIKDKMANGTFKLVGRESSHLMMLGEVDGCHIVAEEQAEHEEPSKHEAAGVGVVLTVTTDPSKGGAVDDASKNAAMMLLSLEGKVNRLVTQLENENKLHSQEKQRLMAVIEELTPKKQVETPAAAIPPSTARSALSLFRAVAADSSAGGGSVSPQKLLFSPEAEHGAGGEANSASVKEVHGKKKGGEPSSVELIAHGLYMQQKEMRERIERLKSDSGKGMVTKLVKWLITKLSELLHFTVSEMSVGQILLLSQTAIIGLIVLHFFGEKIAMQMGKATFIALQAICTATWRQLARAVNLGKSYTIGVLLKVLEKVLQVRQRARESTKTAGDLEAEPVDVDMPKPEGISPDAIIAGAADKVDVMMMFDERSYDDGPPGRITRSMSVTTTESLAEARRDAEHGGHVVCSVAHLDNMGVQTYDSWCLGVTAYSYTGGEFQLGQCTVCGTTTSLKCGGCRVVFFCSKQCQAVGFDLHRLNCSVQCVTSGWRSMPLLIDQAVAVASALSELGVDENEDSLGPLAEMAANNHENTITAEAAALVEPALQALALDTPDHLQVANLWQGYLHGEQDATVFQDDFFLAGHGSTLSGPDLVLHHSFLMIGDSSSHLIGKLSDSVVMAISHMQQDGEYVAALMDDGASEVSGCARTMDGVIPGTLKMSDAGTLGVGTEGAVLRSHGSHLYIFERLAANGNKEVVVRRLKYTPTLPIPFVFSEASENYQHGCSVNWPHNRPRELITSNGKVMQLFMSEGKLGFLKVKPIKDPKLMVKTLQRLTHVEAEQSIFDQAAWLKNASSVDIAVLDGVQICVKCQDIGDPSGKARDEALKCSSLRSQCEFYCLCKDPLSPGMFKILTREQGVCSGCNLYFCAFHVHPLTHRCSELAKVMSCVKGECEVCPKVVSSSLMVIGTGEQRATGMGKAERLKGVDLLRREHIVSGHASVAMVIKRLTARKDIKPGAFTKEDVELFIKEGCAICEVMKMRRRAFSKKSTPLDNTKPIPGKVWEMDALELRVPAAEFGFNHIQIFVDRGSSLKLGLGMNGYTADETAKSVMTHRVRVRPFHGEILIIKGDSHPSHRSHTMSEILLQIEMLLKMAPPHVHEGVGRAENVFLHAVPMANALLKAAIDLGEDHFYTAFQTAIYAWNESMTGDHDPPSSALMRYYGLSEAPPSPLYCYGSPTQALVHGEARSTKFDDHAKPVLYVGPPIRSDSNVHCAVWDGVKHIDCDIGCINVNEWPILQQSLRDNKGLQPFGQLEPRAATIVSKPTSLEDYVLIEGDLPVVKVSVWVSSAPVPTIEFLLLIYSGKSRSGDIPAWVHVLSDGELLGLPVDKLIGGQEHNTDREEVWSGLKSLVRHERCLGVISGDECNLWSALRFQQPGPEIYFNKDFPDGIPMENGELPDRAKRGMQQAAKEAELLDLTVPSGKIFILEHPACQGKGEPYAAPGRELHSTIADTSVLKDAISKHELTSVFTDQCMSGASTRKPTVLLCCPKSKAAAQRVLGVLICNHDKHEVSLVGVDEEGHFKSTGSAEYKPEMCKKIAIVALVACGFEERRRRLLEQQQGPEPATDDLWPVGSRVEIYWTGEREWYIGTVTKSFVRRSLLAGRRVPLREIEVRYDFDNQKLTHKLNGTMIRSESSVGIGVQEAVNLIVDMGKKQLDLAMLEGLVEEVANDEDADSADAPGPLFPHVGELYLFKRSRICLETFEVIDPEVLMAVINDKEVVEINPLKDMRYASQWHEPKNQREYEMSPQRDLWRTAMELKMDEYQNIDMYDLVPVESVDRSKYTIYPTLWVFKIKTKEDGTFKLSPRWCVQAGDMDREVYKSYSEMVRISTVQIIWAIKAAFWNLICQCKADAENAFQATRTVNKDGSMMDGQPEFYCQQARGFTKFGPKGEKLCCRVKCFMQGRIDSTKGFDERITALLKGKAGFKPLLYDKHAYVFDTTKYAGTAAPLDVRLQDAHDCVASGKDTAAGETPYGWALCGQHVDDFLIDATGKQQHTENRIVSYMIGTIAIEYACRLSGWQDGLTLGFNLDLNEELQTITVTAEKTLNEACDKLFADGELKFTPKHIMTESTWKSMPGQLPSSDDLNYLSTLEMRTRCQRALGAGIWLSIPYPQLVGANNAHCVNMANPSSERMKDVKHSFLYLRNNPIGKTFGGKHVGGIMATEKDVHAFTTGQKMGKLHVFSDASVGVTGGAIMLAGGCVQMLSARQHLASPSAHTSETVAAGTILNLLIPINGVCQELSIRLGEPTPFYLDSLSTVFVALDEEAPKKSIWIMRRTAMIQEAVKMKEIKPIHISEYDMVADSCTKYIKHSVWARHMHYVLNLSGDPPDAHEVGWILVPASRKKGPKNIKVIKG